MPAQRHRLDGRPRVSAATSRSPASRRGCRVHRPSARDGPGDLHAAAGAPARPAPSRAAPRAPRCVTAGPGVPSGTLMVKVFRTPTCVPAASSGSFGCGATASPCRCAIPAAASRPGPPRADPRRRRRTARASAVRRPQRQTPQAQQVPGRCQFVAACRLAGADVFDGPVRRPVRACVVVVSRYSMVGSSWCVEVQPPPFGLEEFQFFGTTVVLRSDYGRSAGTGGR